jgi:toluene monooxygenase system ferredoxin subunit
MRHRVATYAELWNGDLVAAVAGGQRLVLAKIDDTVHAFADRCAHLAFPLSEGTLEGRVLTCAAHQWQYDVTSGRGINPSDVCLVRFAVTIEDGGVFVEVP